MLSFTLHRHLQENPDVLQCLGLTQDGYPGVCGSGSALGHDDIAHGALLSPCPCHLPLLLIVAEKSAVVGGVGVVKEGEEQPLTELQREGELPAQLPHTVEEEEEEWCFLLQPRV